MKKLVVFKKLSNKTGKPYYQVCEVEGNKFNNIGFAQLVDKTLGK